MADTKWKKQIQEQMKLSGTYKKDRYTLMIGLLEEVLKRYSMIKSDWIKQGKPLFMQRTSDRGATNTVKHPSITMMEDCEKQIVTIASQLGLSPASLKKIDSIDKVQAKDSPLTQILKQVSDSNDSDS